jgi:hypothetical protein
MYMFWLIVFIRLMQILNCVEFKYLNYSVYFNQEFFYL